MEIILLLMSFHLVSKSSRKNMFRKARKKSKQLKHKLYSWLQAYQWRNLSEPLIVSTRNHLTKIMLNAFSVPRPLLTSCLAHHPRQSLEALSFVIVAFLILLCFCFVLFLTSFMWLPVGEGLCLDRHVGTNHCNFSPSLNVAPGS